MAITVTRVTPLFQVYDMRESVAWYRDVLGFELLHTHEPDGHFYWAMLKLGDAVIMLNSKYEDEHRPGRRRLAAPSDVTLYFSCPDVDAAYQHLLAKGAEVAEPKVTYYGMKQLIIKDPDGFELCFQQPAPSK